MTDTRSFPSLAALADMTTGELLALGAEGGEAPSARLCKTAHALWLRQEKATRLHAQCEEAGVWKIPSEIEAAYDAAREAAGDALDAVLGYPARSRETLFLKLALWSVEYSGCVEPHEWETACADVARVL